jgi:molybdopterin-dependent oxidoreductase alpha subunit
LTWNPKDWAGFVPNGFGQVKPNHYLEMARVAWQNRDQLPYAWRILTQGVCDGCALGTTGLRDFTMDGVHLCMVRLDLLRLNTGPALDVRVLEDGDSLARLTSAELRELGRLPYPMVRRRGDKGFVRVTWDVALDLIAQRVSRSEPDRLAFYLTSRGLTNETYYVAQKAARFLGTNNIDNSSRLCHAPSTTGLKQALGVAASTCSYTDWIGSDLLVIFGSNTPNNQPVTMKYIYYARRQGTRVAVVNPYREPGLERYWVPSVTESALFGTKIADDFFQVNVGGDQALIAGTIRHLIEQNWIDEAFIREHTTGFDELKRTVTGLEWELLENRAGMSRQEMLRFARLLGQAKSAIFIWSMGITQHRDGVANVRAIADLALVRGFIGRPKCGLMAIRGHSGVQGGAEMGAVPNQFPGGVAVGVDRAAEFSRQWGFEVPAARGLDAVGMVEAAHAGEIDVFYQCGGNFLETLPKAEYVREAVARVPTRVHQDIVLSPQMMIEPNEIVVLLPARTRYEQPGGGTETSTERRILFSPEIPGRRIGESWPEWQIPMAIAERARPQSKHRVHFEDAAAIRREIGQVVPFYDGIQHLSKAGDQVQWGGERLCEEHIPDGTVRPVFKTKDGKAHFSCIRVEGGEANGKFRLSTRRGKQFNSMVHDSKDPLNGAERLDVLINAEDALERGLSEGDWVRLSSRHGEMNARCRFSAIARGNIQVHWPEGNVLLEDYVQDPESGIPDFNALVDLVKTDLPTYRKQR